MVNISLPVDWFTKASASGILRSWKKKASLCGGEIHCKNSLFFSSWLGYPTNNFLVERMQHVCREDVFWEKNKNFSSKLNFLYSKFWKFSIGMVSDYFYLIFKYLYPSINVFRKIFFKFFVENINLKDH